MKRKRGTTRDMMVAPSFIGVDRSVATRLAPDYVGLVPLGSCPNVPKNCGHCHYCRVAKDGPEYWREGRP